MKRIILALLLVTPLVACESKKSEAGGDASTAAETPTTAEGNDAETAETAEVAKVEKMEFDDKAIAEHLPAGEVVGGFAFSDSLGKNYVAFSKEEVEKEGTPNTVVLHIRHVVDDGDKFEEIRAYREVIEDCDADILLEPKWGDWSVTDLDEDGIGEATFAYTASCQSDISPSPHKVLVTEKGEKYALRGNNRVVIDADPSAAPVGGEFEADEMPEAFASHAKEVWEETAGPASN